MDIDYNDIMKFKESMDKEKFFFDDGPRVPILNKAGECLKYSLGNELLHGGGVPNHFDAFLAYFTLLGKINRDDLVRIEAIRLRLNPESRTFTIYYKMITEIIVDNLKRFFRIRNFDSLLKELDRILIPDWVFGNPEVILKLAHDAYLVDDRLYYIAERDGSSCFRCTEVGLLQLPYDSIHDIRRVRESLGHTISMNYSRIIGFDKAKKVFYLEMGNTHAAFAAYRVETDQEEIFHKKCLGVIGGAFPVLTDGWNLSIVFNGKGRFIKEQDAHENYIVRENYIHVEPRPGNPSFFKPYKLLIDGNREQYSYAELAAYILDKVHKHMKKGLKSREMVQDTDFLYRARGMKTNAHFLSLEYFEGLMENYNLENNKAARVYHVIDTLMFSYISRGQDFLEYLYMFADVSSRLNNGIEREFISEKLYWKLNELHLAGKLKKVFKDVGKLRSALLENESWKDKTLSELRSEEIAGEGTVGCFLLKDTDIEAFAAPLSDAVTIGGNFLMKDMHLSGVVSYNLENGRFDIRYERILLDNEKDMVRKAFHVEDKPCRFYVDH